MSPYSIDQVSIHLLRKSGPYDQYPYSWFAMQKLSKNFF
jgi:hypothetical protein